MSKIKFLRTAHINQAFDAAHPLPDEDPVTALVEAVIDSIATEVFITVGDTTVFLAMLQDVDHWQEDWLERGITDPNAFIAALVDNG